MPVRRKTKAELLVHTGLLVIGTLVLAALTAGAGLGAWRMYERLRLATDESDAADRQLALLSQEQVKADAALQNLSTERGIEAALRERYGVARPGEEVIQIVDTQDGSGSQAATSSQNVFVRVFRTFFVW